MVLDNAPILLVCSFKDEEIAAPKFVSELLSLLNSNFQFYKLILIDDGSTDNTAEKLESFATSNVKIFILKQNIGKVAAQSVGVRTYIEEFENLVFFDGDGQHDPSAIISIITAGLNNSKITIGKRTTQYKRKLIPMFGTFFLKISLKALGIGVKLENSELLFIPSNYTRNLVANPDFGFLPLNLIVHEKETVEIPIQIKPRLGSENQEITTRHLNEDLLKKALIQIYSKPFRILWRLFILGFFPMAAVISYGFYVGFSSLMAGNPNGAGSIIVIISFSTFIIITIGLLVIGFLVVINEWIRTKISIESELK